MRFSKIETRVDLQGLVLESLKNGEFYIGSTSDLEKRVLYHNNGWARATKGRGPWELVYFEGFNSKADASKRESEIKNWKSKKLIKELTEKYAAIV